MMRDIPEPEFEDPKEVYAFFGLAMYNANLVEASLINLAVALKLNKIEVITRDVFEASFGEMEFKTLGQLLKATQKLTSIPLELEVVLKSALDKRNFLAHSFYRVNAEKFIHKAGKISMIKELCSMIELFRQADEMLTPVYMELWQQYGVSEDFIQKELERSYKEAQKRYEGL